ncbi:MAG TPA: methyltransferase [bacterium]|nr:methyltransferase [bacterium]HPN30369.1 methyltransferase [bacterium]
MNSDYSLIEISPGLFFYQNKNYKFSSDSIRLFDYIKNIESGSFLELGCGDGIVSALYAGTHKQCQVFSLDINPDVLKLLKKTVEINNIGNMEIIESDLEWYSIVSKSKFDLVCMNPPYYNCYEGKLNDNYIQTISKHQILCCETSILNAGFRLIKKEGRFVIIYPAFKITDKLFQKIRSAGFKNILISATSNSRFNIIEMSG